MKFQNKIVRKHRKRYIMKKITYWTVRTAVIGGCATDLYFHEYTNAKEESKLPYRDKPVRHTVKVCNYEALCAVVEFED